MNKIVTSDPDPPQVPQTVLLDLPNLAPWLAGMVAIARQTGNAPLLQADQRLEAGRRAQVLEAWLDQPITQNLLVQWLDLLRWSVTKTPTPGMLAGRATAILRAAPTLPRAVLNRDTQAAALRSFTRWPASADLIKLLEANALELRRLLRLLYRLSLDPARFSPAPIPKPRAQPSEAEIAHVAAATEAIRAAVTPPPPRPRPLPAYIGREDLARLHAENLGSANRQFAGLAAARLAALRDEPDPS